MGISLPILLGAGAGDNARLEADTSILSIGPNMNMMMPVIGPNMNMTMPVIGPDMMIDCGRFLKRQRQKPDAEKGHLSRLLEFNLLQMQF
jgi:hypothetical protein